MTKIESEMTLIETRLIELDNLSIYGLTISEEQEEKALEKRLDQLRAKRDYYWKRYQREKALARYMAQELQGYYSTRAQSWEEVAENNAKLYNLAKRYGLVKEFKENGII